ncbi:MAG: hypothetical protein KJ626_00010 [Verrucomicrobia bacterium]|nr:hypothetical protein [Verrucomicrobiota bacterium]
MNAFNRFNHEVEKFLVGSDRKLVLDDVHLSIDDGSYKLVVFLTSLVAASVEPDMAKLAREDSLSDIDRHRARIVRGWQERARKEDGYSVSITPGEDQWKPVKVTRETDYHSRDQDEWIATEKYVVGRVLDIGGAARANVHIAPEGGGKQLIVLSNENYLRDLSKNYLYHDVQVHIAAEENIRSGELRNERLLSFVGEGASFDEDELDEAIKKGSKAWSDVKDSVAWVREQRGDYDE